MRPKRLNFLQMLSIVHRSCLLGKVLLDVGKEGLDVELGVKMGSEEGVLICKGDGFHGRLLKLKLKIG